MRQSLHVTRPALFILLLFTLTAPRLHALEKQPAATYHTRRMDLAQKLNGGVAVLFAAEEPLLDFMPYRQDANFYYLTGWNEPGAALMIVADAPTATQPRHYREVLFLPTRNLRMEKYTGIKLDAATPNAAQTAGVDEVLPMTSLPLELNKLISWIVSLHRTSGPSPTLRKPSPSLAGRLLHSATKPRRPRKMSPA